MTPWTAAGLPPSIMGFSGARVLECKRCHKNAIGILQDLDKVSFCLGEAEKSREEELRSNKTEQNGLLMEQFKINSGKTQERPSRREGHRGEVQHPSGGGSEK